VLFVVSPSLSNPHPFSILLCSIHTHTVYWYLSVLQVSDCSLSLSSLFLLQATHSLLLFAMFSLYFSFLILFYCLPDRVLVVLFPFMLQGLVLSCSRYSLATLLCYVCFLCCTAPIISIVVSQRFLNFVV
jgi:hypothetical protein